MKSTDKFLIGIVLSIVLLVGVTFAVALFRPNPVYRSEETPEGVTHNYLLALRQEDYERAYGYLSPIIKGYPDSAETFVQDVQDHPWTFRQDEGAISQEVSLVRKIRNQVIVTVQETRFYQGSLFDSAQYSNTLEILLQSDTSGNTWKIVEADSYWAWCWNNLGGCK